MTARRKERLLALQEQLVGTYKDAAILCFTMDVSMEEQVNQVIRDLPSEWKEIDILVNNAGIVKNFMSNI